MSLVLAFLEKWKVQIQLLVISHLRSRAVVKAPWKVSSYRHRRAGEMAQLLKAGSQPKCQMWAVFLCLLILETPVGDFILSQICYF